jgi:hypothetical protein
VRWGFLSILWGQNPIRGMDTRTHTSPLWSPGGFLAETRDDFYVKIPVQNEKAEPGLAACT